MTAGCTFDRVIQALEAAAQAKAHDAHTMTDLGVEKALEELRAVRPVAQAVLLLDSPLNDDSEPIERYIAEQHAALETVPDNECDKESATGKARHFVGIAIGLLLADQVRS